jgi:hypothetical protein
VSQSAAKSYKWSLLCTDHNQVWINNGTCCKRVPKEMVDEYLSKGYVLGRLHFKKGSTTIES